MTNMNDPIIEMMDRILGYCRSQALGTVTRLGIPDLLADGPKHVRVLAEQSGADDDYLYRLLRAMSVEGVFEQTDERVFGLTPLSEGLTTDHPRSLRWFAASMVDQAHWLPWGHCYDAVKKGRSRASDAIGMSPWEYLGANPEQAGRFAQAMSNMSGQAIAGILDHYDFAGFERIVDVGGSRGTLLLEILAKNPGVRGEVLDLPEVVEMAGRELQEHPARDRIQFSPGNFFEAVPEGGDAYLLKHILHDWPDQECGLILKSIRKAIPEHGRLLVFDALLVPEAPPWAHWLDVHMMVLQDGKERSPEQFASLFEASGFKLERAIPIPAPVGILEAVPV